MVATNMTQLEQMLLTQMQTAMEEAAKKMKTDALEETSDYYEGSEPKKYVRTGALKNTPNVTPIQSSGKNVSFDVYLDTSTRYSTGDRPGMQQVLELANNGKPWTTKSGASARPTIGKRGFWEKAKSKFQKTLNSTMASFFE